MQGLWVLRRHFQLVFGYGVMEMRNQLWLSASSKAMQILPNWNLRAETLKLLRLWDSRNCLLKI